MFVEEHKNAMQRLLELTLGKDLPNKLLNLIKGSNLFE